MRTLLGVKLATLDAEIGELEGTLRPRLLVCPSHLNTKSGGDVFTETVCVSSGNNRNEAGADHGLPMSS